MILTNGIILLIGHSGILRDIAPNEVQLSKTTNCHFFIENNSLRFIDMIYYRYYFLFNKFLCLTSTTAKTMI